MQAPQAFLISTTLPSIILIRSSKASFWESCISIVNNLEASYKIAFGDRIKIFEYDDEMNNEHLWEKVKLLYYQDIDEIIVIDHFPPLTRLFTAINSIWQKNLPKVTIHTFGGFTYRCNEYVNIEETFKKFPLKIITPSSRSMKFVANHFEFNESLFYKIPFPVSSGSFSIEENLLQVAKARFQISDKNKVITYAGRIAEGKNVYQVIEIVSAMFRDDPNIILLIAGEIDDSLTPGFAREGLRPELSKMHDNIRYLGKLTKDDLKLLYHATDVFISLSTYPLEDFGMGPLEALCCGCPVVLSNWGGYTDFGLSTDDCRLIDVSLTQSGHEISIENVKFSLKLFLASRESMEARRTRSHKFTQIFSTENTAKELKLVHERPYSLMPGFSAYAKAYVWINKGEVLAKVKDTFYHSLYRSYFE